NGGFYSALDADSEGEEGKYYVWTENDLKGLLKHDEQLISKYYNVQAHGNWEHGNNILFRNKMDQDFLQENSLSQTSWSSTLKSAKQILLDHREQRIKPGLDDKIITGWNAMMIGGLIDAYKALRSRPLLDVAKRNLQFLSENLVEGTIVYRSFKGKHSTTQGFLDDYAYLTQAYLKMYQVTFDENLLHQAKKLLIHTLENFYDPTDGYFFFTSHEESSLISRKKEIFDNVIPSSNALMAQNLFQLGILFDHDEWKKKATDMVEPLSRLIKSDPNYMSQWAIVFTEIKKGMAEVVLLGTENGDLRAAFQEKYHPFSLFMGTENTSTLPLLTGKTIQNGKSTIFVCYNKTCQQPVHTVPDAEKMLL
ncbi:MAG TPA: thioredoxin domain-containing protein, partial [Chryseolinea sp.]|nr:thioredoxin domain-containing protein [Chryseolinea sp.]